MLAQNIFYVRLSVSVRPLMKWYKFSQNSPLRTFITHYSIQIGPKKRIHEKNTIPNEATTQDTPIPHKKTPPLSLYMFSWKCEKKIWRQKITFVNYLVYLFKR